MIRSADNLTRARIGRPSGGCGRVSIAGHYPEPSNSPDSESNKWSESHDGQQAGR
jgi:hypothetical protein